MYLADCHTHSHCSPDAKFSMAEMAEGAAAAGMDEICITDHIDVGWAEGRALPPQWDWRRSLQELREARALWGDRISIRLGAELGEAVLDFDGAEACLAEMPEEVDMVIGSLHVMGERYDRRDFYYLSPEDLPQLDQILRTYLEELLRHAKWGRFDVMGHLTLPKRYLSKNHGILISFQPYEPEIREILRTLIERGRGIECNVNRGGLLLPDEEILRLYRQLGGEIITLGSDAHQPVHIGVGIREGQALLKRCGFSYFCTFKKREPIFHRL